MANEKVVLLDEIRRGNAEAEKEATGILSYGDGDGGSGNMNERLGRLEGELGGVKHGQNMLLGGLGVIVALLAILGAFIVGFGVYNFQKVDQTNARLDKLAEKTNALPGKISSDLRDLTRTVSESITAAKQEPPKIILMQAPFPSQVAPSKSAPTPAPTK